MSCSFEQPGEKAKHAASFTQGLKPGHAVGRKEANVILVRESFSILRHSQGFQFAKIISPRCQFTKRQLHTCCLASGSPLCKTKAPTFQHIIEQ